MELKIFFSQWHRQLGRNNPCTPNRSQTYEHLVTCPDALLLSYRRLMGTVTTWLGVQQSCTNMVLLKSALRIHVIGSWSNNDGDNSENGKKTIGLDWQNNNSAGHHSFLYISLPLWHDYYVKLLNFMFCRGCEHKRTILFFFSWTLIQAFRIQLHKKLPTFDELNKMEQAQKNLKQHKLSF